MGFSAVMRMLAITIMLFGTLSFILAAIDLLEELRHLGRPLDYLPTVSQSAGVIGIGALLWIVGRNERTKDK